MRLNAACYATCDLDSSNTVWPSSTTMASGGALKVGQRFTLVGRLQTLGVRKTQATGVWLFSDEKL